MAQPLQSKPLAVTMGDPAGIGPDITLLAWLDRAAAQMPPFFVIGDPALFEQRASGLASAVPVRAIADPAQALGIFPHALPVLPLNHTLGEVQPGQPHTAFAPAIIASIEQAAALTKAGRAAAIVTNPIAKYVLMESGFAHAGHTEFLAELAVEPGGSKPVPVMMMASGLIKAVPLTVHIALKDVPAAITRDGIITTASTVNDALIRFFGIARPRLAVCGLNPHAGENGALGREEIEVIAPAVEALTAQGLHATGPHSADSLFHDAARRTYDAVLTMYHDQALIPFKTLSFVDGVNVTLGLPFIRTSPDHGTAFSLAGTGKADPSSFIEALRMASAMGARTAEPQVAQP